MKYALVVLMALVLSAHAVVAPAASRIGAYERYVLRVPNESDSPTIRVEIQFPDAVRVISFVDVPGWQLQASFDNTGRALRAVWTGSLPPERFVEFPFMGVNPKSAALVSWPVTQTYANGQRIDWSGPRDSERPASVTTISGSASWQQFMPMVIAAFALLVALLSLITALPRRGARTT